MKSADLTKLMFLDASWNVGEKHATASGVQAPGEHRLKFFTRVDAFGAMLEIASEPEGFIRGDASLECYEFINQAQLWRAAANGKMSAIATTLLDIIGQILAPGSRPSAEWPASPPTGAFALAVELIEAKNRLLENHVALIDRVRRTLQVRERVACAVVTVLTDPIWECAIRRVG